MKAFICTLAVVFGALPAIATDANDIRGPWKMTEMKCSDGAAIPGLEAVNFSYTVIFTDEDYLVTSSVKWQDGEKTKNCKQKELGSYSTAGGKLFMAPTKEESSADCTADGATVESDLNPTVTDYKIENSALIITSTDDNNPPTCPTKKFVTKFEKKQ